jgi:hypothetical protein
MVFIACSMCPLLLYSFVYCSVVLCDVFCSSVAGYFVCCDLLYYHCHRVKPRFSKLNSKLRGFSSQANYTHRATAACRRSKCQL